MQAFPPKAPADRLDYIFELDELATGEAIATATITALPSDLQIETTTINGDQITFWAEGGSALTTYTLTCTATTTQHRIYTPSATLYVGAVGLDDSTQVAPD